MDGWMEDCVWKKFHISLGRCISLSEMLFGWLTSALRPCGRVVCDGRRRVWSCVCVSDCVCVVDVALPATLMNVIA